MMRLFIGLGLDEETRNALWAVASALGVRGRLTPKENYHVTLAFLGDRGEREIKPLGRVLKEAVVGVTPLELTITGLGYFGRENNALLHAKLAPSAPLKALSDRLRGLLLAAGETFDPKPFTAHVTLARQADLSAVSLPDLQPVPFTADRLTLYHSTRQQGTLRYLPVYESIFRRDNEY